MTEAYSFKNEFLNSIFRNAYASYRIQLWLFPAVMMYVHDFIKNEKFRRYWALYYSAALTIFNVIGLILFNLGL